MGLSPAVVRGLDVADSAGVAGRHRRRRLQPAGALVVAIGQLRLVGAVARLARVVAVGTGILLLRVARHAPTLIYASASPPDFSAATRRSHCWSSPTGSSP